MRIADFSIERPVFAVMLIAALVGLGAISLGRLGVDLFPSVEFPYVAITTRLEGATPETVETAVSDVIEEHVNTISSIEELRSTSSEGRSLVLVQFELSADVDVKAQEVREKVALARAKLPIDADPPVVVKIDPDASPILSVMVSGELSIRELTRFADEVVKERLQRIPGVGSATLVGGRDRAVRIWVDSERLRSYRLGVDDLIRAIRSEHAEVPGGHLETPGLERELSVKTLGEVESVAEFGDITVAYRNGAPTLIGDVARVEDGVEDQRSYAELDGIPGVSLEIRRQSGENTVEVARAVKAVVSELRALAPPGVRIVVARDISRFIESSARDVGIDMLIGGLLATLITFAFLRSVRSTAIVAIAIPASIVSTFFLFYLLDFTLNTLTLMALSVSIGLLIDDAIVVLESVHRHIELGEPPLLAASRGSAEVGGAVVAGTASVLAVFVPIAFMRGVIGRFFFEYGLAVSFAVGVSLLVAVTLTPTFCARVLRRESETGRLYEAFEKLYTSLERGYARLLAAALRHRVAVICVAVVATYAGVLFARTIPLEFSPRTDRSELSASIELPLGSGIEQTKRVARRVAAALSHADQVTSVFVSIGSGQRGRIHEASFYVALVPKQQRRIGQLEIMDQLREVIRAAAPEAVRQSVNEIPWVGGSGFTPFVIEYDIQGPDLAVLEQQSGALVAKLRESPRFTDVKSGFERGKPEVQVRIDRRRMADLGVPVRAVADTLRALVGGVDVATFEDNGKRYDVRIRLEADQRDDLEKLDRLQVRSVSGGLVDLANVADLRVATGPARIDRQDRSRKVTIYANTPAGVALGPAAQELDGYVAELQLPQGYIGSHHGTAKRMRETRDAIGSAFGLALIALYMILASQFNSFLQPAVIMLSAPLAFVGAFAGLAWTGTALSIFAQIGLIALMGLVMKNGILLVDYANQLHTPQTSALAAMQKAGPVRLRPVLMTTLSTVFGMIPVAISQSDAAEWRQPMGVLVIGGLLSSTLLTLLVVPVVYTLAEDLRGLPGRLRRRNSSGSGAAADPRDRPERAAAS